MQLVLFNVTNGLIIGAFYVLMALGLSLILNLSNVINFAHGNFLALGGYLAFTLAPALGYWGALLVSPLLTAVIGIAIERLMIRRIYGRDPVYSLLFTFGLAFGMQDAARYIWGPNGLPLGLPDLLSQPITPDLFFITWYRVFMMTIVILTVIWQSVGTWRSATRTKLLHGRRFWPVAAQVLTVLGLLIAALRTMLDAAHHFASITISRFQIVHVVLGDERHAGFLREFNNFLHLRFVSGDAWMVRYLEEEI